MARLPVPGSDDGVWGQVLNDYLLSVHNADGSLKAGSVGASVLAANAVGNASVQTNSVAGSKLLDGTVTEAKLDTSLQSKVNSVAGDPALGGDLTGTASNAQIVAGAVGTPTVADQAITTVKLADSSVNSAKIVNGAVDNTELATGAVTDAKIADGTISEAKLALALATKVNGIASVNDGSITPVKLNSDTPATGDVLSYSGVGFEWITPAGGGGAGETNTASNIGTGGVGVYKQKTGVNFELKRIRAGSTKVIVTDNIGNNSLDLDVDTAQLGITKTTVGLGNVDNTSDAAKPVSAATQTALNAKANTSHTHAAADIASGTLATARLGSGTASGSTYLRGDGSWSTISAGGLTAVAASGNVTVASGNVIIGNAATAGFTVTLPAPANGATVTVKKVDSTSNAIIVMRSSVLIDDQASVVVNTQWQSMDFFSDGTKWYRI